MALDPFAPVVDEAQTATPSVQTVTTPEEKKAVTKLSDSKIVHTIKHGSGFDAPWTVIHADSAAESLAILTDPALRDSINQARKVAAWAQAEWDKVKGSSAPASRPTQSAAPAAQAPAAKAGDPECPEGWTYKTGSKNGKTWRAYMPPQGSGESPMWLK